MDQQSFGSEWSVWVSYATQNKWTTEEDYKKTLDELCTLGKWSELAYLWKHATFTHSEFFFTNLKTKSLKKWCPEDQPKKVEAVCFFRSGVKPSWEDPTNKKGGQFTFFLNRDSIDFQSAYEGLIFGLIGDLFESSNIVKINTDALIVNGIRFVDKYNERKGELMCKVQLWASLRDNQVEEVKNFIKSFSDFCALINLAIDRMEFKNI